MKFDPVSFKNTRKIAIQPILRQRYVKVIEERTVSGGNMLLCTLEYNPEEMNGPPFASTEDEIHELYGGSFQVKNLSRESIFERESHWKNKGLSAISEAVYLLTKTKGTCDSNAANKEEV